MPAIKNSVTKRKQTGAVRKHRTLKLASSETTTKETKAAHLSHREKVRMAAGTVTKTISTRRTPSPKALRDDASMLHVRVTDILKQEATKTLEVIGMTPSEAVRLFLHRIVVEQRLPLDLCVPNAATQAAILEARAIAAQPSRFTDADALFDSLEKAG